MTRVGFEKWNSLRDKDGGRTVDIQEVGNGGSGPTITISVENITPLGSANCVNQTIKFDSTDISTRGQWFFRNLATHEMGHILGLTHTGSTDSRDGQRPNMNTCFDFSSLDPTLNASDDLGQLDYRQDILGSVTANAGFENGRRHWRKPGSGTWAASGTSPYNGNNKVRYKGTGSAGHMIYQEANFAGSAGHQITARAFLKKDNSSHTGNVQIRLAIRVVNYATPTGCRVGQFTTGKDHNNRSSNGAWYQPVSPKNVNPQTFWAGYSTTSYVTYHSHIDVRIEIESNLKQGSTYKYLNIDNAYVHSI